MLWAIASRACAFPEAAATRADLVLESVRVRFPRTAQQEAHQITQCCALRSHTTLYLQAAADVYPAAIDHAKLKAVFEKALPPLTDAKSLAAR